uniref:Uncharacterized protein n=1 Tax=Peromyscus maniculatus bairdii TaxID=230844 RepID=A0A8C8W524_PERMB
VRKDRPGPRKRELPQQSVPSSSSWSLGSVVAVFILLSQNKRKCQRRLLWIFRGSCPHFISLVPKPSLCTRTFRVA